MPVLFRNEMLQVGLQPSARRRPSTVATSGHTTDLNDHHPGHASRRRKFESASDRFQRVPVTQTRLFRTNTAATAE
jgi:hypothetical protein